MHYRFSLSSRSCHTKDDWQILAAEDDVMNSAARTEQTATAANNASWLIEAQSVPEEGGYDAGFAVPRPWVHVST